MTRPRRALASLHARASATYARGAALALLIGVVAGVLGVLHYIPTVAPRLQALGLQFTALRPLHATFVTAWIFLAALAIVHRYLDEKGEEPTEGDRWRLRATVGLWALAGLGILVTLPLGITSGREYVGFHPAFSVPILLGWLCFGWTFFRNTWRGFWGRPVHVTMWGVAIPFFTYTFLEQHAWMLPDVFAQPIVDLRIQWKACGTLVGSFNLLMYGALIFLGEKVSGDSRYGCSHLAYALFGVGLLNSFTNFAHHTYHVPQSEVVKWVSFVVSMTEIVILARVAWDVATAALRRKPAPAAAAQPFLTASKWWTLGMLLTSVIISIPPLNSLIHGTHVVTGHAMGTEIGIDTMVLLGGLAWLLFDLRGQSATPNALAVRRWGIALNVSAALLVSWLHVAGTLVGVNRYLRRPTPEWLETVSPFAFAAIGLTVAATALLLLRGLLPALLAPPARATRA